MKNLFMKFLSVVLSLALLLTFLPVTVEKASAALTSKRLIVYFPDWAIYNAAHKSMTVSMIPWTKVTCVNHAFFEVDNSNKLATIDPDADFTRQFTHSTAELAGHFGEYKYYKTQYPNVKIMVSVGGWTRGQNFHKMALTPETRAVFIQSVVDFLKQYPFIDGIDIDWEYPGVDRAADPNDQYDKGCPGGPEDKQNFTSLFRELRQAYNNNGLSGKLLTTAIAAGYDKLELQEPNIYAQYLDWLNVMTFDFHGAWEKTTNNATPMYANPADPSGTSPTDIKNKYNVDYAMKNLRDNYGIPASKLNAATPYYSRGWVGVSGGTNGLFANATGPATGPWDNPSSPGGQYPYFQLKTMENAGGYVKYRDPVSNTPYLYNASQGIMLTYEDDISLAQKLDYINANGFGGMMVWDISGDDTNFTMTNLIYSKIINNNLETVATPAFSPAGGTYVTAQSVAISCATPGATIRYTTNGTDPTPNSPVYTAPINLPGSNVTTTTTIRAIAFKSGMNDSFAASSTYTILDNTTVAPPTFSPDGGTFDSAQNVSISTLTNGAAIRYTTDGSAPTSASALYTGPINVPTNTTITIKAKAFKAGLNDSIEKSASFILHNTISYLPWTPGTAYKVGDYASYNGIVYKCTFQHTSMTTWEPPNAQALWSVYNGGGTGETVAVPTFNPGGGNYTGTQNVTISCATSNAVIKYTTDGSTPTVNSATYTAPIAASSTITIKAVAFKSGAYDSNVASATYNIGTMQTVAIPVISPPGGTYVSSQSLTVTCSTPGAAVRYTLDGSEPTENSPIIGDPISISKTMTVKVKGFLAGMLSSATATAIYTIVPPTVAAPVMTPGSGNYTSSQTVSITCATSGAVIRYTTDGSTPTASSPIYSVPIVVSQNTTIKAYATANGMTDSAVATETYNFGTPVKLMLTISPASGTYTGPVSVTVTCNYASATIRYTVDGSTPNSSSAVWTAPVTVSSSATVKAYASALGYLDSDIASAQYTITLSKVATPTFSPAAGSYQAAQTVTISCATSGATIRYTTDGTTPTSSSTIYSTPINVTATTTIKAIAIYTGMTNSDVSSSTYTITPVIPSWGANISYKTGDLVSYSGKTYKCLQGHTSLPGWEPSNVPALWQAQ